MLEFYNGLLICLTTILCIASIIALWNLIVESTEYNIVKNVIITIIILVFTITSGFFTWKTGVQLDINECLATVEAFQEFRDNYGDNYVVEPETNTNYEKALAELKKYEKLGLYNPYTK